MKRILLLLLLLPLAASAETRLPAGKFGKVAVYIPEGTPDSVAIFVSDDGAVSMAKALTDTGAVVIGVDTRQYLSALGKAARKPNAKCQLLAGDFENLSHQIQKEIGMFKYHVPVLIGAQSGAAVVYAVLVQSPPGTFAGAVSMAFNPAQDFGGAELCPGQGLHYTHGDPKKLLLQPAPTLKEPWIKLPAPNRLPPFLEAYKNITARLVPTIAPPAQIGDLPVTEVPAENSTAAREASGTAASSDEMALLLTGDGGWAGLDQELATRLAAAGVPTVGLNSLKYFWTERTPDQTAQDVARVMRHYLAAWNKQRILLVGYSFGADVLPFVMNRLPPDLRSKVASVSLLGVDAHASFEIKIADWVGTDDDGPSTQPEVEVAAKTGIPVLCIYGEGESDSICPGLSRSPQPTAITLAEIGKGHHFSGAYAELAGRILAFAQRRIT